MRVFNQQAFPGDLPYWKLSAYVSLSSPGDQADFSFGLVNTTAAYVNGAQNAGYVQPSMDWRSIGMSANRLGGLNLYSNNQLLNRTDLGTLPDIGWFYIETTCSVIEGAYSLSATIFEADGNGHIGDRIGSPLTFSGIANPALMEDPTTYFFFGAGSWFVNSAQALDDFQITAVPEPSTFTLLAFGAAALMISRRRR